MVTLNEFIKRMNGLRAYAMKRGQEILKENEAMLVDMQTGQHHEGVNRNSEQMQGGYSTGYSKRRKKKGLQTAYVDLHFTGKYHKSLKVIPAKGGVDLRSDVDYEQYLRKNFPKEEGLTEPNAEVVANIVAERLAVDLKKYLVE